MESKIDSKTILESIILDSKFKSETIATDSKRILKSIMANSPAVSKIDFHLLEVQDDIFTLHYF